MKLSIAYWTSLGATLTGFLLFWLILFVPSIQSDLTVLGMGVLYFGGLLIFAALIPFYNDRQDKIEQERIRQEILNAPTDDEAILKALEWRLGEGSTHLKARRAAIKERLNL